MQTFRLAGGRDPIFLASNVRSSTGRLMLNMDTGISSSVKYQGCRERTEEVAEDIFLSILLNFWSLLKSSSQERRRGEPGLKVGVYGHSLHFFLLLPAQLRLRELIGEEEMLQEKDALAHPTGMMVCSRSAQLENLALLAIHITTKEDFGKH